MGRSRPAPVTRSGFDPSAYWTERVRRSTGLSEVGHRALGPAYNAVIYRRRLETLDALLARLRFEPRTARILDLGCGTGFYVGYWHAAGVAALTGVDLSLPALEALREQYPGHRFLRLDLARDEILTAEDATFDVVTLFDVVYHVLDDLSLRKILVDSARLLAPGGMLLLTEAGVTRRIALARHVVFRSRAEWRDLLSAAGLDLVARAPLFQLLEPPLPRGRLFGLAIAGLYRASGVLLRRSARLATAVAERLARIDDRLLARGAPLANHELWVVRHAASGPGATRRPKRETP